MGKGVRRSSGKHEEGRRAREYIYLKDALKGWAESGSGAWRQRVVVYRICFLARANVVETEWIEISRRWRRGYVHRVARRE
jgi:hypothetical protein